MRHDHHLALAQPWPLPRLLPPLGWCCLCPHPLIDPRSMTAPAPALHLGRNDGAKEPHPIFASLPAPIYTAPPIRLSYVSPPFICSISQHLFLTSSRPPCLPPSHPLYRFPYCSSLSPFLASCPFIAPSSLHSPLSLSSRSVAPICSSASFHSRMPWLAISLQ